MKHQQYGCFSDVTAQVLGKSGVHVWDDPKLWLGLGMYVGIWAYWMWCGFRHSFGRVSVFVLGLNLVVLTMLQHLGDYALVFALAFIFMNTCLKTRYIHLGAMDPNHIPVDLRKDGKYNVVSMYEDVKVPVLKIVFLFAGQSIYAAFYFYSLHFQLKNHDEPEYCHWIAGYICVQMCAFFNREDSQLGADWNIGEFLDLLKFAHLVKFVPPTIGGEEQTPIYITRFEVFVRGCMGFLVNSFARELVAFTVPALLMTFFDPLNCVVYSLAVTFVITLDDLKDTKVFVIVDLEDLEDGDVSSSSSAPLTSRSRTRDTESDALVLEMTNRAREY